MIMHDIKQVLAYEILDSRGNPTIECKVSLESGAYAKASVPSGASTGTHEAYELRDNDAARYLGNGVINAVHNINSVISNEVVGIDATNQLKLDSAMLQLDNTDNLESLGANSILAVSLAAARASAVSLNVPLYEYLDSGQSSYMMPVPFMNILNGGHHADNNIDIQEFMVVPVNFSSFKRALQAGAEIYQALGAILKEHKLNTNVGDEGGYAPNLSSTNEALDYVVQAIVRAGYKPGVDVYIALDVAASEFYNNNAYNLSVNNASYSSKEWVNYLVDLSKQYPIISIEDGLAEDDFAGWQLLTDELGDKLQLIGDDLFVTQIDRLKSGVKYNMANSILIKPNQVGSITGMLETITLAKKSNYSFMISHRSGDTGDAFIADLAVASNAGQIKTGAPCRGERVAKYNRLLEIEQMLGNKAKYAAKHILVKYPQFIK
jgi:enolase